MEPVRLARESGVEPVVYYANPNIHPAAEYARRLETLAAWAQDEQLEVVEGSYDPEAWEAEVGRIGDAVRGKFGVVAHEAQPATADDAAGADDATPAVAGEDASAEASDDASTEALAERARQARCRACYRMRFEETARYAAEHGFAAIGTTLSVSPYQYTAIIEEELERAAAQAGVEARFADYRPYYENATRRSREAGMYRQNYCACRFSEEEARLEREARKRARKQKQAAEAAARAGKRAAEAEAAAAKRAERAAYAAKQARKRAVLKQLREGRR